MSMVAGSRCAWELPAEPGWQQVVAVFARWRVESDWWRTPVTREYWKLGRVKEVGSGGPEPDILCEVYRDRMVDRWQLARVYD